MVYRAEGTMQASVPVRNKNNCVLSDDEILHLAKAYALLKNYIPHKKVHGAPWMLNGQKMALIIKSILCKHAQKRFMRQKQVDHIQYRLASGNHIQKLLVTGQSIGQHIVSGTRAYHRKCS